MRVECIVRITRADDTHLTLSREEAEEIYDALHAEFGDFDQARELSQLARESVARELRLAKLEAEIDLGRGYSTRVPVVAAETGPSLKDDIEAMIAKNSKAGDELVLPSLSLRVAGLTESILTTPDYWDCECDERYIHFHQAESCPRCGAHRDSQPDSRVLEVLKHGPESAAWKFIASDGVQIPGELVNEHLQKYVESIRDPFDTVAKPDDADEHEAESLSRLPRADIEPGEAEMLVQAQPIKCPSNTPEPAAEPEKVAPEPAPSNDQQVKIGRPRLPVSDQDRAVELWTRYRKRFPNEGLNRTVSRLCSHYPQPRPTADEIREWLRAAGIDIPTPMSRSECAAQARDCRLRKPPEGYKIVNAEVWRTSESLLSDADIREMAEGGLARAGLALDTEAVGW
jgi:hypothetical protein